MMIENETDDAITITLSKDELETIDGAMGSAEAEGRLSDYWTYRQVHSATQLFTDKYAPGDADE